MIEFNNATLQVVPDSSTLKPMGFAGFMGVDRPYGPGLPVVLPMGRVLRLDQSLALVNQLADD